MILLPKCLCKDIESLICKFWWGYKGDSRKIHWVGWKKLCLLKCQRGLGFKDIENFNQALLGKQVWRLFHNKDSLFYKVFKLKYFPNCSVMDEEVKLKGLYVWPSIMKAWRVVRLGSRWHIGDDRLVVIWKDRRLPNLNSNRIISPIRNFPSITQGLCPHWWRQFLLDRRSCSLWTLPSRSKHHSQSSVGPKPVRGCSNMVNNKKWKVLNQDYIPAFH